jgi:hypothetical protein
LAGKLTIVPFGMLACIWLRTVYSARSLRASGIDFGESVEAVGGTMKQSLAVIAGLPTLFIGISRPAFASTTWITQERWDKLLDSAAVESPKLLVYLVIAGIGWVIGRHLTILWSSRQKQVEQDLVAARDFHALYGEFFALWKLWNYYVRDLGADALPGASRWALLDRICASEAKLEATLVRLASQRALARDDIESLGRFRQRYQQLRECIKRNVALEWNHSEHPDYKEFKKLATQVAAIIAGTGPVSTEHLREITSNIYEFPSRDRQGGLEQPTSA